MILKRQNMSENKWNHFKIVPKGHNNCQLSIVNCQFGEATKFPFIEPKNDTERCPRAERLRNQVRYDLPAGHPPGEFFFTET